MEICGTGMVGVQLGQGYGAGGLNQIGLMGEQLVAVDVEQRGFDVVVQVCEQQVIALLDEGEVVLFGSSDDIAIGDGEITDGVLTA